MNTTITREQFAIAIKIDDYRSLFDIDEDSAFDIYKLYNGDFNIIENRLEALSNYEDPRNKLEERIGFAMHGTAYWSDKNEPTAPADKLYILHQVNCKNAFGAGFAGYIAKTCPRAKQEYHSFCKELLKQGSNPIGQYCITDYTDFAIVHVFAQQAYGNSKTTGICYTDYESMEFALDNFRMNHPNVKAICPQYMGCGLAGGDWNTVQQILTKYNIIPCSNINLINGTYKELYSNDVPFDEKPVPVKVTSQLPTAKEIQEALF